MALLPGWPSPCLTVRVTPEIMWVDPWFVGGCLGRLGYLSVWFSTLVLNRLTCAVFPLGRVACPSPCLPASVRHPNALPRSAASETCVTPFLVYTHLQQPSRWHSVPVRSDTWTWARELDSFVGEIDPLVGVVEWRRPHRDGPQKLCVGHLCLRDDVVVLRSVLWSQDTSSDMPDWVQSLLSVVRPLCLCYHGKRKCDGMQELCRWRNI